MKDFAWDAHNRLTNVMFRATVGGAATKMVDYPYDMFNRLVRRRLDADGAGSGMATNMFLTGYEGINPTLAFGSTATTDVSNPFIWGPMVDQLFADEQVITPTTAGNVISTLGDHLGTNRDLADFNGTAFTIPNHRNCDRFGNRTARNR